MGLAGRGFFGRGFATCCSQNVLLYGTTSAQPSYLQVFVVFVSLCLLQYSPPSSTTYLKHPSRTQCFPSFSPQLRSTTSRALLWSISWRIVTLLDVLPALRVLLASFAITSPLPLACNNDAIAVLLVLELPMTARRRRFDGALGFGGRVFFEAGFFEAGLTSLLLLGSVCLAAAFLSAIFDTCASQKLFGWVMHDPFCMIQLNLSMSPPLQNLTFPSEFGGTFLVLSF
mmetsp:Transcript_31178/g.53320  ORF Transcript_31178/g.53320 Transcript_31178/m.53320 type:complete len:228 (+) Transcript_31178:154-837(+)